MASVKKFYLCNLIPLWEIDDENLDVDWIQKHARHGDVVEMRVVVSELNLDLQTFNFEVRFDIEEDDIFPFDDHVVTISSEPIEEERVEHRPLFKIEENQPIPTEGHFSHIFVSSISKDNKFATMIRAFWQTVWQEDASGDPEYFFDVLLSVNNENYEERSDNELVVQPSLTTPPTVPSTTSPTIPPTISPTGISIHVQEGGDGTTQPLVEAWIYWHQNDATTLMRTNTEGQLHTLRQGGTLTHSWEYTIPFTVTEEMRVNVYYSKGAKPLQTSVLNRFNNIFFQRVVNPNSIEPAASTRIVILTVPSINIQITKPVDLSLWPLLWGSAFDAYYTDGLNQGAALWPNPQENVPAPATTPQVSPTENNLLLEGTIDSRATGVKIQLFTDMEQPQNIQFRHSGSVVNEINAALGEAVNGKKPFTAQIDIENAHNYFGFVQIVVVSEGINPNIIAIASVHLCGFQIALVNDHTSNSNGQQRGSILGQASEKIIIDFLNSPQPNRNAISAQTRARRMISYSMANRQRALSNTNAAMVLKPEMPLWMAEFQIVGINRGQLEELMIRRNRLSQQLQALQFGFRWHLTLSWDGPDSGTTSPRRYQYSQDFREVQTITIGLNSTTRRLDVDSQGRITNAINPRQNPLSFPISGRRQPEVIFLQRPWGRQNLTNTYDAFIIEFQPHIVNANNNEILRGGDGYLRLEDIKTNGITLNQGLPQTANIPVIDLPRFRVKGLNPPLNDAINLTNILVEDFFNANNGLATINLLPLNVWQDTIRRILAHEADHQFEHRGAGRRRYAGTYYGHEQDMPIFGAPHGYGFGQHDNPQVSDDGAWSFLENIKESIRRIMVDKAGSAHRHLTRGTGAAAFNGLNLRRKRAIYRRELVRRYNGGREFRFSGGNWVIHTSSPADRHNYPNTVLRTGIVYPPNGGPVNFNTADFGPLI